MGATRDDFIKYPRTPYLFGSKGTDDDKHLGRKESEAFAADPSLIVEEKLDGTNVGIHFTSGGRMVLQCRGHEITEGLPGDCVRLEARSARRWPLPLHRSDSPVIAGGFGDRPGLSIEFNHQAQQWEIKSPEGTALFTDPFRQACLTWERPFR